MFGCVFGLIRRVGCLIFLVLLGFAAYQWITWPSVSELALRNPRSTAFIDSYERSERDDAEWRWVGYDDIADELKHAALVGEDIDFFTHNGFALDQLRQAVEDTVKDGEPLRGASTISQQLVKNLWLTPSRNPWRKVKEALLTLQLERDLTKQRILEIYLNVAEFAPGVYGAEAAAVARFGRPAASLSTRQAAVLAACLPSPSACGSAEPGGVYEARVDRIERRMDAAGWVKREL